jgi:hypothetical protein
MEGWFTFRLIIPNKYNPQSPLQPKKTRKARIVMHILQFTSIKTIGHTMGCVKERNVELTVQIIIVSSRCRKRAFGWLPTCVFLQILSDI